MPLIESFISASSLFFTNPPIGTASLPAPPSSDSLKAITIGRGTQNYTCATSTSSSTPVSIGAVADLFDASVLLPFLSPKDGEEILDLLPAYLVTFPYEALANSTLPSLGQHYFEGPTSPVFNLEEGKIGMLNGAKAADIIAPPSSSPGPDGKGNGAVDWLMLTALAGSQNLNTAYRVHTAGGKAPKTCEGQRAVIEVEYAAQYWFYG